MKINISFYIIYFFITLNIYSQVDIVFSSLPDMISKRFGMGYSYDGNKIYAIAGGTDSLGYILSNMESYNLNTGGWTEVRNDLIPRRYSSAEFIPTLEQIFIFNGYQYPYEGVQAEYTDTVEIFNVISGELIYSQSNPYPVSDAGSAVWNGKIYTFGGANNEGYSNRLYEFDPLTLNWTRLPDMPEAKTTHGKIINGMLYVFGGFADTVSNRIDVYDIVNNNWSLVTGMSNEFSAHRTTVVGNQVWIVGDYAETQSLAVFNTETLDFSMLTSNMTGRRHAGAIAIGDSLYVFGGAQTSSNISAINNFEVADISSYMVTAMQSDRIISDRYQLYKNYPNPFNPTTIIKYSIPKSAEVKIKIYDVLGSEIITLLNEFKHAGTHEVEFDASFLSSGVYLYRLISENYSATKKMLLLR